MKKWIPVYLCFLASSCNKPLPDYSNQPFDYTVSGINDTTVAANDYVFIHPNVTLVSGDAAANPITLTFKGLPTGVYLDNNGFSFRLNHYLSDSFGAHNAAQGVYPLQAVFNSAAGIKTYNFNLTVGPPVNRVANVTGGFYPESSCWPGIYVSCEIDSVPGTPGKIMIIDRISPDEASYGTYDTSYGMVDCCSNTFVIPSQKVLGVTVSGYGSINSVDGTSKGGTLTRTFISDTATYTCIVTLYQN